MLRQIKEKLQKTRSRIGNPNDTGEQRGMWTRNCERENENVKVVASKRNFRPNPPQKSPLVITISGK